MMMIVDPSQNVTGRLLPPDIPFRFFGTAMFFHLAAWALLAAMADAAGGLSWAMVACLHLITLGVLAMSAAGASFQLLPVATKRQVRAPAMCRLAYWLLAGGLFLFVAGLMHDLAALIALGAGLCGLALALMAWLLVDNLRGVDDMPVVSGHAWLAALSLVGVLVLGILLAFNLAAGFLADRSDLLLAHGILALFGFMGMLAQGFSTILLPMFALSFAPSQKLGRLALAANALGLSLAVAGALTAASWAMAAGGIVGLAGQGLLGWSLIDSYKKRMRKRTGFFFLPIWAGLAMGPVTILTGLLALSGLLPNGGVLFIWTAVAGWLLTFVLGVLQRIMPFLASMHSATPLGRTPLLSQLMAEGWTKAHFALHAAAVVMVGAGLATDWTLLVRLGALCGLAGAVAYAGYGIALYRRVMRFRKDSV